MLYGKIVPREHVFALDYHYPEEKRGTTRTVESR